jgi:hemoglobin
MKDISDREDIKKLVDTFYNKVRADEVLAPVFNEVIKDWSHHLPIMYNFWSTLLLGDMSYQGNPFKKHIPLPLSKQHFQHWLKLFFETLDEMFEGPVATDARNRAASIATIFQYRLNINA